MLAEFVQKILDIRQTRVIEIDGRTYTSREVRPVYSPKPEPIIIQTLTGLVDYVKKNIDGLDLKEVMIWVKSPTNVFLMSSITGSFNQRFGYVTAVWDLVHFQFRVWMQPEEFIIALQTMMDPASEDLPSLMKLVGNIKDEVVNTSLDDGVSQLATVKTGIAKVENVNVPNPVMLRPYRTFREIEQPRSPFIFRLRSAIAKNDGPRCALFEADGGQWMPETNQAIASWLQEKLPDINIIA